MYDPLTSLSNSEISQLFVQAGSGIAAIPPGGRYYIEALAEFLRCKGIDPYCKMFFACPHQQLAQAIDSAVAAGQLTAQLNPLSCKVNSTEVQLKLSSHGLSNSLHTSCVERVS